MGGFLFPFVFIQHEVTGISPTSLFIAKHTRSPQGLFTCSLYSVPFISPDSEPLCSLLLGVGKQEERKQKCFAFLWGQRIVSQLLCSLPWQLGKRQLLLNIAERIVRRLWQSGGAFFTQVRRWWVRCICWVITKCHSCCVLIPGNASLVGMKQRLREFRSFFDWRKWSERLSSPDSSVPFPAASAPAASAFLTFHAALNCCVQS